MGKKRKGITKGRITRHRGERKRASTHVKMKISYGAGKKEGLLRCSRRRSKKKRGGGKNDKEGRAENRKKKDTHSGTSLFTVETKRVKKTR